MTDHNLTHICTINVTKYAFSANQHHSYHISSITITTEYWWVTVLLVSLLGMGNQPQTTIFVKIQLDDNYNYHTFLL